MKPLPIVRDYFTIIHSMTVAFQSYINGSLKLADAIGNLPTTKQQLLELNRDVEGHAKLLADQISEIANRIENPLITEGLPPCDLNEIAHCRHVELREFWRRSSLIDFHEPESK